MKLKAPFPDIDVRFIAAFWKKVVRNQDGKCWGWSASKRNKGYGAFCWTMNGIPIQGRAHRFSWMIHHGEIPDGMMVLHKCDTPECSNPDHLFLGTNQDNVTDMMKKNRHVSGGTKCGSNGKWRRGLAHWNSRLSNDSIDLIKRDRSYGMSYSAIAKKHDISIGHAHGLITGDARKYG